MITKDLKDTVTQTPSNLSPPPYDPEPEEPLAWKQSLDGLQQQIAVYQSAEESGDSQVIEQEAPKVASAMRKVGDSHTDPEVKAVWYKKANKFLRSKGEKRHEVLQEVGAVIVGLIKLPFALAGCALCVAGGIINAVGSVITGIGDALRGASPER
jgi:hypothetical protein